MAPYTDNPGFWGPATSTIDWCEENYQVGAVKRKIENKTLFQVSWYIAEFWNTVSNLSMIFPAIYGIIVTRREGLETRSGRFIVHQINKVFSDFRSFTPCF